MYVHVDLTADPPAVELREREDCTRLHVEAHGAEDGPDARARVDQALRTGGFGSLDSGAGGRDGGGGPDRPDEPGATSVDQVDSLLDLQPLRAAAGRGRPPGWEADFDGMIAYARSKGWVTADDRVRAHVVWSPTP